MQALSDKKDFLTWLLIGWQLRCQPIRYQVWISLLTNLDFDMVLVTQIHRSQITHHTIIINHLADPILIALRFRSDKHISKNMIPQHILNIIEHVFTPKLKCVKIGLIKWKHFTRYWPLVWGIRGALMLSMICSWINSWVNGWVNNREAGDLRRYRVHYDVTVMMCFQGLLPCLHISWGVCDTS